jgi:hypothetical protein
MSATATYETKREVCADCEAPLQESPSWAEVAGQTVYRCPWVGEKRFRVEHQEPTLLIFNCNWPKGAIARRISGSIQ